MVKNIEDNFKFYKKGEFCKSINCVNYNLLMNGNKNNCYECYAYKFHDYLNEKNYLIITNK